MFISENEMETLDLKYPEKRKLICSYCNERLDSNEVVQIKRTQKSIDSYIEFCNQIEKEFGRKINDSSPEERLAKSDNIANLWWHTKHTIYGSGNGIIGCHMTSERCGPVREMNAEEEYLEQLNILCDGQLL